MLIQVRVDAVDEIIRRHDGPRIRFPNRNLKRSEVELSERPLSDERVYRQPIRLLLIPNEIYSPLAC
jgi:hypothetical protein